MGLPTLKQIVAAVNCLAPPGLAEDWDRVGLQVDRAAATVRRVMVALDLNSQVIQASQNERIDGFIVHHPFFFKPLTRISHTTPQGRILAHLIQNDQFVLVAHTNLDKAAQGLNQYLAELLGLTQLAVLEPATLTSYKVVVFCPEKDATRLHEAMTAAGAGELGNYWGCSFNTQGIGTFYPDKLAKPYIGQSGNWESVPETRLEMVVSQAKLAQVLQTLNAQHPYEEPAVDIYPLHHSLRHGLGRIGTLPKGVSLKSFGELVKSKLPAQWLKVSGDPTREIRKVAICSGSGSSLVEAVVQQQADLYLTGELNYHAHWEAREQGLAVVEAGHGATEQCFIPLMSAHLNQVFATANDLTVLSGVLPEQEPYRVV
jgi:dinuclear metal center YbgI/SA1388 family protein